jgi:hypothetical protein
MGHDPTTIKYAPSPIGLTFQKESFYFVKKLKLLRLVLLDLVEASFSALDQT